MAVGNLTAIVEFSVVSLPSLYFETYNNLCTLAVNGESFEYGIGPNTLIINTLSGKKLYLNNSGLKCMWGFMEFNIILEDKTNVKFSTKRTVQIIIDDQVEDDKMVVSDDLLFNLKDSSRHRLNNYLIFDIIHIVLINNTINNSFVPSKATRVSLSLYQSESHFEEDLLDEALHKYFAYPKYLCKGDVFSIQIDENKLWTFMDVAKVDTIYFKVCEIEDNTKKENSSGLIQGFLVDSSVTVYQVSNHQGFYPPRRVPLPYKLCTQALLNDGVLMPYTHCPVPQWFDEPFKTLVRWFEPFFCRIQDIPLKPVFLLSGPNGSGKSFLLHALSQLFGVFYWRVDCVTISGQIPSQAEAKLKAVFAQLKNQAPCILHLSSIQALYQDLNMKDDVRAICCFEEELKNMNLEWPVIIVGTTCNVKSITSSIHNLFLDSISLGPPNSNHQRKSIISWLLKFNSCFIDDEIMDSVASQTSGFMFRDLQVIVALAFKQKYKRSKDLNVEDDPDKFILEDFSKTIELMHKAYSESIGAPKVPHVSWQDVGGLEPLKKEIIQSLRSNMLNSGLRRSGLLLHGPPGTGKTLLAKAVATECGRNFLSVKGPELLNMYVGQSEQNVRDLFELAKASSPCIVFFDELDSLAPNRGRNGDSGGVMDRVVSQLLSEMDELTYTGDVFMLGATNRPDLIDPALLRPGRLDKLLYVGPCEDRNSQLSVLTALTRKLRLEPDVDLEAVVSRLPTSVSGAQLSALCSAAWMTSARRAIKSGAANKPEPKIVVNQDHFLAAIGDIFRLSM